MTSFIRRKRCLLQIWLKKYKLSIDKFSPFDTTIHKLGIVVNRRRKEVTCFLCEKHSAQAKRRAHPHRDQLSGRPLWKCVIKGALLKTTSLLFYHTRSGIAISAAIRMVTGSGARENDTGKDLEFESRRNYWRCQLALHKSSFYEYINARVAEEKGGHNCAKLVLINVNLQDILDAPDADAKGAVIVDACHPCGESWG